MLKKSTQVEIPPHPQEVKNQLAYWFGSYLLAGVTAVIKLNCDIDSYKK